jgi:hypothetical protein
MERPPMFLEKYCDNGYTTEGNQFVQCNPHQNSNDILYRDRKINPEVHKETQINH